MIKQELNDFSMKETCSKTPEKNIEQATNRTIKKLFDQRCSVDLLDMIDYITEYDKKRKKNLLRTIISVNLDGKHEEESQIIKQYRMKCHILSLNRNKNLRYLIVMIETN